MSHENSPRVVPFNSEEDKTSIGTLIDAPIEEFISTIESMNLNLTGLTNIKKGFEIEYQRAETIKNDAVVRLVALKGSPPHATSSHVVRDNHAVKVAEIESLLNTLYVLLQLIEDRATVLQRIIHDKSRSQFTI